MNWSKDKDDILRGQAASYGSFSDAAQELGITRNAVAGRAHRLGIRFSGPSDFAARCSKGAQACWDDPIRAALRRQRMRVTRGCMRASALMETA